MKNLQELGASPFRYIVLVRGEHFVLYNLLKSIFGSSSQAGFVGEPQTEIAEGALVIFVHPDKSPLVVQDPKPAPQSAKKKGKIKAAHAVKKKKGKIITGHIKAADARLKGFVDWLDPTASDPVEEREDNMSSLVVGFSARMHKRAASA